MLKSLDNVANLCTEHCRVDFLIYKWFWFIDRIAQVYWLSVVHCHMTLYSQKAPDCVARYSQCQPMKSLLTKRLIRLFLTHIKPGRKLFRISAWWFQHAFWRPNWSIIQNMTFKYDFFWKMVSIWPQNKLHHCCAGKNNLDAHLNSQSDVNKTGFHTVTLHLKRNHPAYFFRLYLKLPDLGVCIFLPKLYQSLFKIYSICGHITKKYHNPYDTYHTVTLH